MVAYFSMPHSRGRSLTVRKSAPLSLMCMMIVQSRIHSSGTLPAVYISASGNSPSHIWTYDFDSDMLIYNQALFLQFQNT